MKIFIIHLYSVIRNTFNKISNGSLEMILITGAEQKVHLDVYIIRQIMLQLQLYLKEMIGLAFLVCFVLMRWFSCLHFCEHHKNPLLSCSQRCTHQNLIIVNSQIFTVCLKYNETDSRIFNVHVSI